MNYLLDTNVICELVRIKPNKNVLKWIDLIPVNVFYVSVLSLGEIRKGIEKIADTKRKQKLLIWLEHALPQMFITRILPITAEIADRWGRLQIEAKRTLLVIDSLLAATALHHDMVLVTRNVKDFADCSDLELVNPWEN